MKKIRIVVVNGREIEMLDVRNLRGWTFPEVIHLEGLCSNLSTDSNYKDLWDYVVKKPKWDEIFPADQYIDEARVTFQDTMLPVLLPVIGYSHIHMPEVKVVEQLQQLKDEGLLGTSSVPINFMSGPRVSQFLHLVRFMGIRYPSLAQGLSRRKEWREIEEAARKDGFEFKDTDCREYTPDTRKSQPSPVLLPVWIRHRLAHPENKREKDFPTESDYRRAIAILGAAIAGTVYSDTDDNEHPQERLNHD